MEDHRDELVLIVAGYPDEMATFIDVEPRASTSRFRTTIAFADYTDDELVAIFESMCADADFTPDGGVRRRACGRCSRASPADDGFGNARFVRNLFEAAVVRQAWRLRDVPTPTIEQLRTLRSRRPPGTDRRQDLGTAATAALTR